MRQHGRVLQHGQHPRVHVAHGRRRAGQHARAVGGGGGVHGHRHGRRVKAAGRLGRRGRHVQRGVVDVIGVLRHLGHHQRHRAQQLLQAAGDGDDALVVDAPARLLWRHGDIGAAVLAEALDRHAALADDGAAHDGGHHDLQLRRDVPVGLRLRLVAAVQLYEDVVQRREHRLDGARQQQHAVRGAGVELVRGAQLDARAALGLQLLPVGPTAADDDAGGGVGEQVLDGDLLIAGKRLAVDAQRLHRPRDLVFCGSLHFLTSYLARSPRGRGVAARRSLAAIELASRCVRVLIASRAASAGYHFCGVTRRPGAALGARAGRTCVLQIRSCDPGALAGGARGGVRGRYPPARSRGARSGGALVRGIRRGARHSRRALRFGVCRVGAPGRVEGWRGGGWRAEGGRREGAGHAAHSLGRSAQVLPAGGGAPAAAPPAFWPPGCMRAAAAATARCHPAGRCLLRRVLSAGLSGLARPGAAAARGCQSLANRRRGGLWPSLERGVPKGACHAAEERPAARGAQSRGEVWLLRLPLPGGAASWQRRAAAALSVHRQATRCCPASCKPLALQRAAPPAAGLLQPGAAPPPAAAHAGAAGAPHLAVCPVQSTAVKGSARAGCVPCGCWITWRAGCRPGLPPARHPRAARRNRGAAGRRRRPGDDRALREQHRGPLPCRAAPALVEAAPRRLLLGGAGGAGAGGWLMR